MAINLPANDRLEQTSDYFQSHRFVVQDTANFIQTTFVGGFASCSLPEQNIEHLEYAEGNWTYSRYYPGRSSFNSITLGRGVVKGESKFYTWLKAAAEGSNYRSDVRIYQIHRSDAGANRAPTFDLANLAPSRILVCKNCMPIRYRPGHDLEAMTSDISIEEVEFQPEYFTIETPTR